jgi:hypothetical protein
MEESAALALDLFDPLRNRQVEVLVSEPKRNVKSPP